MWAGALSAAQVADLYAAAVADTDPVTPPDNAAPTAAFTSSTADLVASFDGTGSADSDGTVTDHSWAFGDGSTGTGATTSHTYAAAGTYTVTLTVTDDGGATATISHPVTVTAPAGNAAPTAAFTSSTADLVASFDGTGSADSDGTVTDHSWAFGDGSTGTGATTSHTYAAAGTYTVTLTVTDDGGATATISHPVTVTAPAGNATVALIVGNPTSLTTGDTAVRDRFTSLGYTVEVLDDTGFTAADVDGAALAVITHSVTRQAVGTQCAESPRRSGWPSRTSSTSWA